MLNIHSANLRKHKQHRRFEKYCDNILSLNGIKDPNSKSEIINLLSALYSGKNRFYHTWAHILFMLDKAIEHFPGTNPKQTIETNTFLSPSELLAILFHDVIYVPGQIDNEGRSVDLMMAIMAGYGVPITEFCWASRCIKETANFMKTVDDESTHAVLDLDLCALANPYNDFIKQNALISKEYPNVSVEKRKKFFKSFLQKDKIFYRLTHLEEKARHNINKYLDVDYIHNSIVH